VTHLLLATLLTAAAATAEGAPSPWPSAIAPWLDEKGPDGGMIIGEAQRAYFLQLPEHTRQLMGEVADSQLLASARHANVLLSLDLSPQALELALQDNCVVCHTDPGIGDPNTLFSLDPKATGTPAHLNLKEFISDVHFRKGLSCSGCHGGTPQDEMMTKAIGQRWPKKAERHQDRTWIPAFCARCHADQEFMRNFNPSLPTDQLAKYQHSRHGQLLLEEHDSKAAQCVSCHGVHGIRDAKSRLSRVHPQQIPETCGTCHANAEYMAGYKTETGEPMPTHQLAEFKQGVHGKALLEKGDLGAPACNTCHGNHAAAPPKVASVSQVCRTCHALNGQLFDGSKHKAAFEKHQWPECGQCHGKHAIAHPTDALIGNAPGTLCGDCHAKFATDDPKCAGTAVQFKATLDELAAADRSLSEQVERVAEKGLDVEPLTTSVSELEEALVQTRTRVHSFDQSTFDVQAAVGREAAKKGEAQLHTAREEFSSRRRGLLGSIASMGVLAVVLYLRIRQMEKKP